MSRIRFPNRRFHCIPQIKMDNEREGFPITALREIKILKDLHHPCVVSLECTVTDNADARAIMKDRTAAFYMVGIELARILG